MRSGHGQLDRVISLPDQLHSKFGQTGIFFPSHWDRHPLPSLLHRTMKFFILNCFIDSRSQSENLLILLPTKHLSFLLSDMPKICYVTVINLYFASLQYVKHAVKNEANFSSSIRGYINYLNYKANLYILKHPWKIHIQNSQIYI